MDKTYKRFLVFKSGNSPAGGLGDVNASFDSLKEAIESAESALETEPYIFDCDEREVCWEYCE